MKKHLSTVIIASVLMVMLLILSITAFTTTKQIYFETEIPEVSLDEYLIDEAQPVYTLYTDDLQTFGLTFPPDFKQTIYADEEVVFVNEIDTLSGSWMSVKITRVDNIPSPEENTGISELSGIDGPDPDMTVDGIQFFRVIPQDDSFDEVIYFQEGESYISLEFSHSPITIKYETIENQTEIINSFYYID